MKKLFIILSLFSLLFVSCSKPSWHQTSQGLYVYTIADDKYELVWTGEANGCMVSGNGQLISYNKNGREKNRVSLNTTLGVASEWRWLPCESYSYLGETKRGLPNGFGVKNDKDSIVIGIFKKGELYSGNCQIYQKKDSVLLPRFQGMLKKGKVVGVAKYYQNGILTFEGSMDKGLRHGVGKEYCNGKLLYDGYYKKGKRHGAGKLYKDGVLFYDGEWYKGKKDGDGTEYNENGLIVYDGEWKDDVYDGKGKLYKDGQCIEGKWEEGTLTKTISTSVFNQIKRSTNIWLGKDSLNEDIEVDRSYPNINVSQTEFITLMESDLTEYLSTHFSERIEKRFGFWHLLRMLVQPWTRSDIKRAKFAQSYFCEDLQSEDIEQWINAKIDYYNKNNSDHLNFVKIADIPSNAIVDTGTAIKIFDREALETTDVLAGVLVDILICLVIAFILGLIIVFFIPAFIPYAGIIDIIMGIIAFGVGIYLSIFRTSVAAIELEDQICQMLVDNYMLFLDSQSIIEQMLGLL